jgi:hypothetical protein
MRPRRLTLMLALLLGGAWSPASAQNVVTSAGPDSVDVTVYRDPQRPRTQELNLRWLNGYALVSETRTVTIPAGESDIRFEGVAGGILPQSAIVTGFPEGIIERNRDAYLLSPGTLLERSLGRRVTVRRTSTVTGAVREEEAVIRSGANGAVVLQTPAGFEALRCTGQAETIIYPEVPQGLSTRPTLSVRARSSRAVTATVTLSYLASGFDWQANYIAELAPDGRHVGLFAWLTLASTDETSFPNADVLAVAGHLNRRNDRAPPAEASPLSLNCWPAGTTSDIDSVEANDIGGFPPPAPPAPAPMAMDAARESIVVTGSRLRAGIIAQQEELGDLKLYRIPEPVTVAANSQKQIALLVQPNVTVQLAYRQRMAIGQGFTAQPATRYLVSRNRTAEGLGVALPSGGIALFSEAGGRRLLIGQGSVDDRAIGEDVEIALGDSPGVLASVIMTSKGGAADEYRLTVTNDQNEPVRYEAELDGETSPGRLQPIGARFGRRDGRPLWAVTVPAHGRAVLRYRMVHARD